MKQNKNFGSIFIDCTQKHVTHETGTASAKQRNATSYSFKPG